MTDPYPDDRAYVRDELTRLDCRLRIKVDRFEGPIDEFGALYVSEAEVRNLLWDDSSGGGGATHQESTEYQRLTNHTRKIRERRRATAEADEPLAIDRLVERFDLDPLAREALILALAPDLEEAYATVYAYLQDDATRRRPTVGFILGLLGGETDQLEHRAMFTPGSPLVDADLLVIEGESPLPARAVRVDRRVAAFLLGEDAVDPALAEVATVSDPETALDDLHVAPDHRETLSRLAETAPGSAPPMLAIHGPPGTGKHARVAALCRERGDRLLTLDETEGISARETELFDRLRREAKLSDTAVHIAGVLGDEKTTTRAIERLDSLSEAVFLTGESTPSNDVLTAPTHHEFVPVRVDRADYDGRRRHWEAQSELPVDIDPATLASTFRLSRGAIDDAMEIARASARADGGEPTASHVYEACRAQSNEELSDLATQIDPVYDWDDIVLPAETEAQLREVADRLTDRGTVYANWGFAEVASLGNGLVALFSGPSGTGKTMAAEVVAAHAGLHLYKIDLAAVVSKYVGETESNLGRVFDEAGDSDAVLLFDEADALFGERSEVSDAHDRYANVEVDYLLQRVEEHDGSVLLTTNLESNIDDAFLRRIHVGVEFPLPDRQARAEIWRRVFPDDAPVGDLDYDYLSRLDLTGGSIRNVALTAAFFAADDGSAVEMENVVRAVKREYQKTGTPIQPDSFGEYRHIIETI